MALTEDRPTERRPSRLARAWDSDLAYAFRRSPEAMVSALVVLLLVGSAIFAPWIAPHDPFDPATLNLMNGFTPPSEPVKGGGCGGRPQHD